MICDDFENEACATCNEQHNIVIKEKRCEYRFINNARTKYCVVRVDSCLVTNGKRCDYLLLDCDKNEAYLIELKGSDITYAIEQILSTLTLLANRLQACASLHARIVSSKNRVPNFRNHPTFLKLQKQIRARKGTFFIKNITLEDNN